MNRARFTELEVLARAPAGRGRPTPLLFVHGAHAGAWCWDEHFLPHFAELGYCAYALSLSGHGASSGAERLEHLSLDDYVQDVVDVVASLPSRPVLIGHSMGGLVVQKFLEAHPAPGAVLMASVPPQGLLGAAIGLAFSRPSMLSGFQRLVGGGEPDPETLRTTLFHHPVEPERLARYARLSQPESRRALWDMSLIGMPYFGARRRPPMLIVGARHDVLIPPEQVELTALSFGLQAEIVPDIGHGMMLERNWRSAAEPIAAWLDEQGF